MRLSTITNWAYAVTVTLTLASGAAMLAASSSQETERAAVAQRYALDQATSNLDVEVNTLSALARQYVVSGHPTDLAAYQHELSSLGAVEERTRHIADAGARADELDALHDALRLADGMRDIERAALAAASAGDRNKAIDIAFSTEFGRELERIRQDVERFQYRLDQRTELAVQRAEEVARAWRLVAESMLVVTGLVFLFVLYFIFRRRVLHPVVKLSDVVNRLAAQDFAVEPPRYDRIDEIGDMAQALRVFRENGLVRQRLEREREADRAMRDSLSRMTQRLHGCNDTQDLIGVVERFTPELLPQTSGRLYLLDADRNVMVAACSWKNPQHSASEFPADACWGIRRGSLHRPAGHQLDVPCAHLELRGDVIPDSCCLPLAGQHGALGMLYLEHEKGAQQESSFDEYLRMLAENVGLALDNLHLRDTLRELAMADSLTGLRNRRQLDLWLRDELTELAHAGLELSCAMIDIDYFKRFNDDHGHDAGDAVLRAVGRVLRQTARDADLVFRYGGEEFVVLMVGLGPEEAMRRAEALRVSIAALVVDHDGQALGPVTASIGVASAPAECSRAALMQVADGALFEAKRKGRNRVERAVPARRLSAQV
ncbi:sensor domain-containing diguanylate cyclase [Caballeronia sp. LZ034LL]|uniref:sensor domain-containing diguanylate cyclase n=1 Tax=Caballeronia sp. LZ034LL TaxID=3038567 RepID=UPI002861BF17|nr:sensor domain-containing diguanylate cyclase [Caballeronia sp. LZ034LL]MDR5837113.1 sensor domain-containing diguanylate cyclase [Caballeronia sp. LZ034LL]